MIQVPEPCHDVDLAPGMTLLCRYQLRAVLGEGGMGIVFAAWDLKLDVPVAVKVLKGPFACLEDSHELLLNEARCAALLRGHPNVCQAFDFGVEQGWPFLVLERIAGPSLEHVLGESRRLRPSTVAGLAAGLARVLEFAHDERRVVHGDLKPSNVLFDRVAGGARLKLTDFGLARRLDRPEPAVVRGRVASTLPFMAPELFDRARPSAASDLYALGVLLYRGLAGRLPFEAWSSEEIEDLHRSADPAEIPGLGDGLESIVRRCLSKSPQERPESAARLHSDLARVVEKLRGE